MQALEQHIIQLFKEHDCVIVPEFGGFLLNYTPSRFSLSGELLPPSRMVSFNRNLRNNDGLLANYIAANEQLSYLEALQFIRDKVESWKSKITSFSELRLDDIGVISLNSEEKWQFVPACTQNFLRSSFGLLPLQLIIDEEDNVIALKEVKNLDRAIRGKRSGMGWLAVASFAAMLFILAGFVGFYLKYFDSTPLIERTAKVKTEVKSMASLAPSLQKPEVREETTASPNDGAIFAPEKKEETKKVKKEILKEEIPAATLISDPVKAAGSSFYVIAGAFSSEKNAGHMVKTLKKKGYKAEVLNNNDGLFRVSYRKDADSLSAVRLLKKVRRENQSAWILKW